MAQHGPDLAQHKPKMGPRWLNMGPTWPNMGTTCVQHRPRLLPYRQALRIMPASVLNIALPGFARRISAQSSHAIRQTSLLGRRPAVRRKPLNNFSIMCWFFARGQRCLEVALDTDPVLLHFARASCIVTNPRNRSTLGYFIALQCRISMLWFRHIETYQKGWCFLVEGNSCQSKPVHAELHWEKIRESNRKQK